MTLAGPANFPVPEDEFPVRTKNFPCFDDSGNWLQAIESFRRPAAKIVVAGQNFANSLLISLLSGNPPPVFGPKMGRDKNAAVRCHASFA